MIDTESDMGKRDRAIILTAATTGLRACDLIRLKLSDKMCIRDRYSGIYG